MKKFYLPADEGGTGAIRLSNFLVAQNISWVIRSSQLCIDNWRFDMREKAPDGNIHSIRALDFNPDNNPILFNLAKSYEKFLTALTGTHSNFKKAEIFMNSAFKQSSTSENLLDINFFGVNFYNTHKSKIRSLTYNDLFNAGFMKSARQLATEGLPLSLASWMRLHTAMLTSRQKFELGEQNNLRAPFSKSALEFMTSCRKG